MSGTVIVSLRANTADAAAQAPLQRAQRLPFEPVERITGRMRLRDCGARELPVPIVVMAVGAGQIELTLPLHEEIAALRNKRCKLRVIAR
jgi:hypothetical protein